MNDKFDQQKDILVSIQKEIKLLHQQVDYLIRNEKPLELLDLDVMMNRTHTLYDLMCGVDLGEKPEEELPVGVEEIKSLFGLEEDQDASTDKEDDFEEDENLLDNEDDEVTPEPQEEEETPEVDEDAYFIEEADDEPEPQEPSNPSDETGFILNFEVADETPQEETTPQEEVVSQEEVVPQEEIVPQEEPHQEEIPSEEAPSYEPMVIGEMEPSDDTGFELEQPETLGERYQQSQEETLGEKLQHSSVNDLQKAIGINDKFLFVNELFAGSMEKYNRSIENLNDLKTLNGALIYLNELRIELQWNSNNEAYKKLLELVHRKFEA